MHYNKHHNKQGLCGETRNNWFPPNWAKIVNQLMQANFADIVNVNFTAEMENKLDKVEEGSIE